MTDQDPELGVTAAGGFPRYVDRGGFRFFSGAIGAGPTPPLVGLDFSERAELEHRHQAMAIFDWLEHALAESGGVSSIARLHLYQQDKRSFPIIEDVRIDREGDQPAPSSGIGVEILRDNMSARWEVDGIAMSPLGFADWGPREKMEDLAAGRSASHYSQAVRIGPYYFLAGMIPIDVTSGRVVAGYADIDESDRHMASGRSHTDSRRGPIVAQTYSLLRRIIATVEGLGCSATDIANCMVFLQRPLDGPDVARVFDDVFGADRPSLQVVTVDEVGHKGTLIEIESTVAIEGVRRREVSAGLRGGPAVVVTDELAFVSDQIGTDPAGMLAAPANPRNAEDPALGVQLSAAFTNLTATLGTAGLDLDDVGMLYVQVVRPFRVSDVAEAIESVLDGRQVAITVTSVRGLAHSPSALVAMSTVAGVR